MGLVSSVSYQLEGLFPCKIILSLDWCGIRLWLVLVEIVGSLFARESELCSTSLVFGVFNSLVVHFVGGLVVVGVAL